MSKKDYIAVADMMAQTRMTTPTDQWVRTLEFLIDLFDRDNERFDEEKFREACYAEVGYG